MKIKTLVLALLLLIPVLHALAQDDTPLDLPREKTKFDWNKLELGGNVGGGFSNGVILVDVAPTLGYHVTERFMPRVGITYQYIGIPVDYISLHIYGANIFSRF